MPLEVTIKAILDTNVVISGLPLLEKPDPTADDIGATDKERKDAAFKRHA